MILDETLEFADAVDVSAAAGTANIGDIIDLSLVSSDIGTGEMMYLVIQVTTTFTSGGAAVVQFALVSDATTTIAVDGSETRHALTDAFVFSTLTAGRNIIIPLPGGWPAYERYLGLNVITSGATTTAGAINAFLTKDARAWSALPDAVN